MAASSTTEVESTKVDEEVTATLETHQTKSASKAHNLSDVEKETLAAYEGHDADIPSNEGYVLDERGELKRRQSIAASHRRSSFHSGKGHEHANIKHTTKDIEQGNDEASADEPDPNLAWWDGPDDPENPINFGRW